MSSKPYLNDGQYKDSAAVIDEPFQFGWCLQCSNKQHSFLSPPFFSSTDLSSSISVSLPESSENSHNLRCTIWSTGIM